MQNSPRSFSEKVFESLIQYGQDFVINYGFLGLFFFSFTESFIQPIPVDPVLVAAVAAGFNPHLALIIALAGSMLGASVGYLLGIKLGHPIAIRIFGKKPIDHAEVYLKKWGVFGVALAALTPFPFKIATWAAGIFEMPFAHFLISAILGRGLRFAIVTYGFYGLNSLFS